MRKRPTIRRNIVLFAIAVALIIGLIVVVARTRGTITIMPPESPDILALRASPDTAYRALEAACEALPPLPPAKDGRPSRRLGPRSPFSTGQDILGNTQAALNAPLPATAAAWFGSDRPDDDPELAKYVQACAPVIADAEKAFSKPYALPTVDWNEFAEMPWNMYVPTPPFIRMLGSAALGESAFTLRVAKDADRAAVYALSAARLGAIVQHDGPLSFYESGSALQVAAMRMLLETVPNLSADAARSVLREIETVRTSAPPPATSFEFQLRMVDHVMRLQNGPHNDPEEALPQLGAQFVFNTQMKGFRQLAAANREALTRAAELPCPEFVAWTAERPELARRSAQMGPFGPVGLAGRTALWRSHAECRYVGAELAIAVELFHRDRQSYPDTLEALVPQYLAALPPDPFTGKSFIYRVDAGTYWLYSAGVNQVDDGGREAAPQEYSFPIWFDDPLNPRFLQRYRFDIVIHRPPLPPEPASPRAPRQQLQRM